MHACPRGDPHEAPCYKWLKAADPYTNASEGWVVVVGADFTSSSVGGILITVTDVQGDIIDSFRINRFDRDVAVADGITTSITEQGMMRRMLVPPNAVVAVSGTPFMSLVECACLEDALAIL